MFSPVVTLTVCLWRKGVYCISFQSQQYKAKYTEGKEGMKMKQCDRDSWQVIEKKKHFSLLLSLFHLAESLVLVGVMEAHLLCNTFFPPPHYNQTLLQQG